MPNQKFPWWRAALLAACLSCFAFAQTENRPQNSFTTPSPDEAALRSLVDKYFDAYARGDVESFLKLWSRSAEGMDTRRQTMQRNFSLLKHSFSNLAVSIIKIEGDRATLRAAAKRSSTAPTGQPSSSTEMRINFECIKEDSEWRFRRETSALGDFMNALSKIKTEAEGKALMEQEKDLGPTLLQEAVQGQAGRAFYQNNYPQALVMSKLVKSIAEQRGDKKELSNAWNGIGVASYLLKSYPAALEGYGQSLKLEEELGNKDKVAGTLLSIGHVYFVQSNFVTALEHYQKGLAAYEGIGKKVEIADALEHVANAQYEQGKYDLAIEACQKSLSLRDEAKEKVKVAAMLDRLGGLQYDQGNYATALDYYQQALAKFQPLGDQQSIVRALHNVANIHYLQGDFGSALEFYYQSLGISEKAKYREGMSGTLFAIGLVRHLQGNLKQALEYYGRCLTVREALDDKPAIAEVLANLGGIHFWMGEYDRALEYFQRNKEVNKALGDKDKVAWAMLDMGMVYAAQKDFDKALSYYQESRTEFELIGHQAGIASIMLQVSMVHYAQEKYDLALEQANQATKIANGPELFWHARFRAGKAYRKLEQLTPARQAFEEAIKVIESQPAQPLGSKPEQRRLGADKLMPYLAMVDLLISQGQGREAFVYAERAKAKTLLAMLQGGRAQITKGMTAQEQEQEQKLKTELAALSTQIGRAQQREQNDPAILKALIARGKQAQQNLEAFRTRLFTAHPELKALRGEAPAITLEQAFSLIPDHKTALLEYVETDESLYCFVLSKELRGRRSALSTQSFAPVLNVYEVELDRYQIAVAVTHFQKLIVGREDGFQELGRELYDLLLRPAQEQLTGKTSLFIVPTGALWQLPFQALQPSEEHYLLEEQAVALAPSLTALRTVVQQRNRTRNRTASAPTLFAFGNPTLGKEEVERVKAALGEVTLGALSETEKEVEGIGQLYRERKVFVGVDASEARAKAEAGTYRVLHLAAHGLLNDAAPMYSHLLLTPTEEGGREDGLLEAWEIMQWELQAQIAVLPMCAPPTPAGSGNGMIGMTWALLVAGCPTTLTSQWKVASESTTELMVELHRNLSARPRPAPLSKAQAWQRAAMKLMQNSQYRHPFFWSGFWVMGDGF